MRLTRARVGATCALLLISVATERASARQVRDPAAIALDGRIVFESHPGMADLEHGVPVDPETRFGIASVTKMVTAVALLQQVEAGAMALDDPVRRHVPDFPAREGGPITLETLATHRSGLPHPSERTPALFATHYETATEAMEVYRDVDLAHAPHRARRYSFYHPWTYAESETLYRVPTWDYSFNPGGGNLTSTVRDLVAFGSALIDGRLLTPGSMERRRPATHPAAPRSVAAGVDEIAHLPGFRGNESSEFPDPNRFLLTEEDGAAAAEAGVVVVSTLANFAGAAPDSVAAAAAAVFRHNLSLLKRHGVPVAVGSDGYGSTGIAEIGQIRDLGVFTDLELLKAAVETTPRTIFPERRIGRLEPGWEASFLVLDANPLEDFSAPGRIALRVKRGLPLAAVAPGAE